MSDLVVFAFDTEDSAEKMSVAPVGMQKQKLITLEANLHDQEILSDEGFEAKKKELEAA